MNFQNLWLYTSLKTSRIDTICLHMSDRVNVQHRLQLHIPVILCSNLLSVQLQVKWTVTPDGLDRFIVASFLVDIYYHKRIWHRLCFILVNCVLCFYGSRWCASNDYPQIQYEQCSAAITGWITTYAVLRAHIRSPLLVDRPDLPMSWYHDWWRS